MPKNTTDKNQDLQKAEQLLERLKIELWETKKNIVRGREGGGKGGERIGWLTIHGAETGIWLKKKCNRHLGIKNTLFREMQTD